MKQDIRKRLKKLLSEMKSQANPCRIKNKCIKTHARHLTKYNLLVKLQQHQKSIYGK